MPLRDLPRDVARLHADGLRGHAGSVELHLRRQQALVEVRVRGRLVRAADVVAIVRVLHAAEQVVGLDELLVQGRVARDVQRLLGRRALPLIVVVEVERDRGLRRARRERLPVPQETLVVRAVVPGVRLGARREQRLIGSR